MNIITTIRQHNMAGHLSSRILTKPSQSNVHNFLSTGVPARQVLTCLRQEDSTYMAAVRTVYNAKAKCLQENMTGSCQFKRS